MSALGETPFWRFSLAVYGRPGVAEACLELQDRHALDVNLLLYCCWAGSRGRRLSAAEMGELIAAVGPWHEAVVRPLRAVRRWLKDQDVAPADLAQGLRREIKARELDAEKIEQSILSSRLGVGEGRGSPGVAAANLQTYLRAVGIRAGGRDRACMTGLLAGGFEALRPGAAAAFFE